MTVQVVTKEAKGTGKLRLATLDLKNEFCSITCLGKFLDEILVKAEELRKAK